MYKITNKDGASWNCDEVDFDKDIIKGKILYSLKKLSEERYGFLKLKKRKVWRVTKSSIVVVAITQSSLRSITHFFRGENS